jgi:N6-L-threonylcarbamoyladenine synthase
MVLGVDTSCYRTSLALADGEEILAESGRLLDVPAGERGLRQSEALFQHVKRLPELLEALMARAEEPVGAVAVSVKPRPAEDSYMPVFTAGASVARSVASALRVPLIETTHQQGHVRAALVGCDLPVDFLAVHLSGGTTEVLRVGGNLSIDLLGGTADISAGQLVDRVGVALGLSFPAGPHLEALAVKGEARSTLPVSVSRLTCSLSGAEAALMRMIQSGAGAENVAAEVYSLIARTLARLISQATSQTGLTDVLLAGGVTSSALLRALLPERIRRLNETIRIRWAKPELSGDNAAGVALIGCDRLKGLKKECA